MFDIIIRLAHFSSLHIHFIRFGNLYSLYLRRSLVALLRKVTVTRGAITPDHACLTNRLKECVMCASDVFCLINL